MNTPKHTTEPWVIHDVSINQKELQLYGAGRQYIGTIEGIMYNHANTEANADRIVACVNACAGIPTEDLPLVLPRQQADIGKLVSDYRKTQAQRDEALALLKEMERVVRNSGIFKDA
jgi:hypothetical protein